LLPINDRHFLETVNNLSYINSNDKLKNICQIEHSSHRSFGNFLTNLVSPIIAYHFLPKKPSLKFETVKSNQLTLF